MNRRHFKIALASCLSATSILFPGTSSAKSSPLILGIFPRRNIKPTYRLFMPLAEYLGQVLQREVRLETSRWFSDFWLAVKQRQYDLVHFNQYHYIVSHQKYGYEVILKNN